MRLVIFYSILVMLCFTLGKAHGQDEFQRIESRITDFINADAEISASAQDFKKNVLSIQPEGRWPDIDYASRAETNWAPLSHLNRLKQFALALHTTGTPVDGQLARKMVSALRYWLQQRPVSTNWFQNDIASPTAIGEILLLLKGSNTLPATLQDSLIRAMKQGDVLRVVGANKVDIAVHMMYRACLTKDQTLMDSAAHQAFLPVTLGNRQGLQQDYAYLQHGPQLQIASYGQVFLIGAYKVASWLRGTAYALPEEKLKILDHYLTGTFLKTIRGRYIDFNTEGRGISRNDVLDKMNISTQAGTHSLLALAKLVNPENAVLLDAADQRIRQIRAPSFGIKPSHTHFYKGDYTIHNRPAYSFNVRTVSKRTVRTESGNKENLKAKFLPDGSTNIQRTGAEYFNIMPVWEWDKIPGVTGRDYPVDQKMTIDWGERGVGAFIGGTSDGVYGTTVYQLNYDEVTAKKAWFFFDDEVVCLGADISSMAREVITTTVNQAWAKGPVKVFDQGIKRFWQDSIAYYFPAQGNVRWTSEKQTGSWFLINANRSKAPVQGKVFKLWFDHGHDPLRQTYAYVVKPGMSEQELINNPTLNTRILANTPAIQAVENETLQMVQVVFHEAGTLLQPDFSITADQPCVLMVKNLKTRSPVLYVADPTQTLTDLHLGFRSAQLEIKEPFPVSLPQGDQKGATVTFQLN